MIRLIAILAALVALATACSGTDSAQKPVTSKTSTKLTKAYKECPGNGSVADHGPFSLADGGHTFIASGVKTKGIADLACVMVQIDTPQRIAAAMDSTTAMMGRQHEEDGDFTYEWSYHPDNGFDLIIEED